MAFSRRSCLREHPPRPLGEVGRGVVDNGKQVAVGGSMTFYTNGTFTSSSLCARPHTVETQALMASRRPAKGFPWPSATRKWWFPCG